MRTQTTQWQSSVSPCDLTRLTWNPLFWRAIMSTKTNTNGQERKTLASQLDRLDAILDTLGEGLNEAVAGAVQEAVETAVREGVHQGVRGALAEILTNPEIVAVLRAALT